jgi:hypothetical protein
MKSYIEWFQSFTRSYLQGTPEDQRNFRIKVDHSLRVLDNAVKIGEAIGLSSPLSFLSRVAALFHDVGRFPQYARYRTFNDTTSANHARLGVDVLRTRNALSRMNPRHRRLVLAAIFLHNRRAVPAGLRSDLDTLVRIIRDADKIDIFSVLISHMKPNSPQNGVVTLSLKPHPSAYTEKILHDVQCGKMGFYNELVWINDLKLFLCSWVYDLNFSITRKMVLELGYIQDLLNLLPKDGQFLALKDRLESHLGS